MADIVVKNSKIQGKGVFAARDFKKGEVIIRWSSCSRIISKKKLAKLPKSKKKFVSHYQRGKYVLFSSPGKYVNHSCNSNTKAKNDCDVAIRAIKKGEEITADYILEKVPVSMKCKCGSKNCKRIIKSG